MAFLLEDVRKLVRVMVQDDGQFVKDTDELDLLIEGALRQLNRNKPLTKVFDLVGDGTQSYDLGSNYQKDFSLIKKIEHPAGETPPVFRKPDDDWFEYEDPLSPTGQQNRLRFRLTTPAAAKSRLTSLDVDTIDFQSGTTIRYTFNTSPDLSNVVVGDQLVIVSATKASNNGSFFIIGVNDASDFVDVFNTARTDNTDDEATDSPAVGTINDIEIIRVMTTKPHTLTLSETTLDDTKFQAVAELATSKYFRALSGKFEQSTIPTIDADSVDYQGRAQTFLLNAERHLTTYNKLVGISDKVVAAQAMAEADIIFSQGEDMLFHRRLLH